MFKFNTKLKSYFCYVIVFLCCSCAHKNIKNGSYSNRIEKSSIFEEVRDMSYKSVCDTMVPSEFFECIERSVKNGMSFVLVYNSKYCSLHDGVKNLVERYDGTESVYFYGGEMLDGYVLTDFLNTLNQYSPSVFYIKNGILVDVTSVSILREDGIKNFISRDELDLAEKVKEVKLSPVEKRRFVVLHNVLVGLDLKGFNMKRLVLKGKQFDASDLRNVQFDGAKLLKYVNFSGSNLQGATLNKAAVIERPFWGSCVCPDGTLSREHGYTCEGHLEPLHVEGIAVDPDVELDSDEARREHFINSVVP